MVIIWTYPEVWVRRWPTFQRAPTSVERIKHARRSIWRRMAGRLTVKSCKMIIVTIKINSLRTAIDKFSTLRFVFSFHFYNSFLSQIPRWNDISNVVIPCRRIVVLRNNPLKLVFCYWKMSSFACKDPVQVVFCNELSWFVSELEKISQTWCFIVGSNKLGLKAVRLKLGLKWIRRGVFNQH